MVALIFSASMNPVRAQGDTIKPRSLNKCVSVAWENDLYFRSDYYYTNGMQLEAFNDFLKGSPVNRILVSAEKEEDWEYFSGLQLRQEMYTPTDLSSDTILIGDHPYVSTLILSQYGVLGPASSQGMGTTN